MNRYRLVLHFFESAASDAPYCARRILVDVPSFEAALEQAIVWAATGTMPPGRDAVQS